MLTVFGSTDDIIRRLELGEDDYLVKLFGVQELIARVSAVLRRINALTTGPTSPGNEHSSSFFQS